MKIGFDNEKYIQMQSEQILNRISQFGGKLYLEFGGKLFDDYHASRVLPGFAPDSKIRMLTQLKDSAEIVIVISSNDIEKNKLRGDIGITYDQEVLRLIDAFRSRGLYVGSVAMTRFNGQAAAEAFQQHLENLGLKVYRLHDIPDYPSSIPTIASDSGFGKNDYIETQRNLVVITAPGPGSGKMAACLSQLYHESRRGVQAGYAKFETFPIWNLPLKHPVNLAYEAATADLADVNMIDPFHLEAYGTMAVNYNRDVEIFPVLRSIFEGVLGHCPYKSPTDMGVNMAGYCIFDDEAVNSAARSEIIRRHYNALVNYSQGGSSAGEVYKTELLMKQAGVTAADRPCIAAAMKVTEEVGRPACAIELPDGRIVTGKMSDLLQPSSAMLLNALKVLGGIEDIHLLSPQVIEPVQALKTRHLDYANPRLQTEEVLLALSICAANDETARLALEQLDKLKGCDCHSSVILSQADAGVFKRLCVNLTSEPRFEGTNLYHK